MYFDECKTLDELKQLYKKLCFKYHPDLQGGSVEKMQEVNAEYEKKHKILAFVFNESTGQEENVYDWTKDLFAEVIQKIITFDIDIEIIGSWIWCFNSFNFKEQLKELGFWFSKSKKAWVYSGGAKKMVRGHYKMNDLREKWGCEKVETKTTKKVTA